jgi:chitodextrinase
VEAIISATLRKAALVVGAVALVATGVGTAVGAGLLTGGIVSAGTAAVAGTLTTIGTFASVAAGALTIGATLTAKKPTTSLGGDQTRFTANKDQGLPYPMGRTSVSGFIVHRNTSGVKNVYQTFFAVLAAAGPIQGIESFNVDKVPVSFANGAAIGEYNGWMWLNTQLGNTPEATALSSPITAVPGWDASSMMSGYAGYAWTLKYDDKGKKYAAGVPEPSVVLSGVKAYDPIQDSTYPGGSGPHRANDESTWTYSDNPFLHGLTWLLGRHQNGKRVIGVGAPLDGIDVAAYVEARNIALANGWKIGGTVYSTDEKWAALKAMLQAGGGQPSQIGAVISCTINAPRVSLDTIRASDLAGDAVVSGTQSRRSRINAVVPRYRSEEHGWEMVPAALVKVDAYIAEDGGQRTKEIEFPLVQEAGSAAQLAAYEIVNAREFGPITLPLKPRWIGYKPGDCLTIDLPDSNMVGQTALVINRSIDPSTGVVTLTLKSETTAKHDFALGRTPNPPPTPSLQVINPADLLVPGVSAVWDAIADPNGTKPEDNATRGAPDGTYVGDMLAEQLAAFVRQLDHDVEELRDATSTDLDPPGQPSGLTLISSVKTDPKTGAPLISLTIKWTANTEADMAGYELQVQEGTGGFVTYSAISNSYTLTGVAANTSYTAKVRAYDKSGNRSAFSAPVSVTTVGDTAAPAAPTSLTVTPGIGALVVRCIAPADADVSTVRVWSNTGGDFGGANLAAVLNAEPGQPVSTSRVVPPGEGRWFWVEAVDTSGNVSPRLGPVSGVSGKVDAAEMADGIIDQTKIAQGLQLPQLAMTANMNDGSVVAVRPGAFAFNVVDGMVYRNSDAAHPATSWIPSTANLNFVVGQLTAGSIAAYAIGTQQLAARAVTANNLAVVGESLFPDGQLQDHAWWNQNTEANDLNSYFWYDPNESNEYRNNINAAGSPTCWVINSDSYKGTAEDVRLVLVPIPGVTGGKIYEIACRASNFGSASRDFLFVIQWFDGSKNYLPNKDVVVGTAAPGEIAKRLAAQVQAPPGAAFYRPYWTYKGTGIIPYGAGVYFGGFTMREANGGTMVIDGTITANKLAVDSVMANSIIAATSVVTGTFAAQTIASLDTLPGRLTVDNNGYSLSTMAGHAFDPAARINANTTTITPGRIQLVGGSTLSSWLYGGDNSLFDGGKVAANTLRANSAVIGLRGVQVIDIAFDTNRLNTVGWSQGFVEWQDDAGNRQVSQINGGSFTFDTNNPVQVVYVWFDRVASHANHALFAGMPAGGAAEILSNPNNIVLATYRYGTTLAVYYGRTIIDGDSVKTGTVQADRLVANSITGTYIAGGTITGDKIAAETILAGNIRSREIDAAQIRIGGVDVTNLLLTSMSKYGQSSWSGEIVPAPGTTTVVPGFNITIPNVYPSGYFYITYTVGITPLLNSYVIGTKTVNIVWDGGLTVSATDANGNVYSVGAQAAVSGVTTRIRVPATVPFNASFNAVLVLGNINTTEGDSESSSATQSQRYRLNSLNVEVAWSAV